MFARRWKLSAGCIDCGYTQHHEALDFDHVVGEKRTNIAAIVGGGYSMQSLVKEIAKCVVRCSNCHRAKTAEERP